MPNKQPRVIRTSVMVMIFSAAFTIFQAVHTLQNVGSIETVNALGSGIFRSFGLSVTTLQNLLQISANIAAVLGAAAIVLAIFAGRGSRQARIGLAVLAAPMLVFGGLIGIPFVVAVVLLFTRQAAPWFGSAAVPDAYAPNVSAAIPSYPTPPVVQQPDAKRPSTVTAAGVITIVLSSVASLVSIIGGITFIAMKDNADLHRQLLEEARRQNVHVTEADLVNAISILGWVCLAVGVLFVLGIVAGALTLRGNNGMRILTIVLASLTIALSVLTITTVVSLVWLIGSIVVIVFLAQRRATDWFNGR